MFEPVCKPVSYATRKCPVLLKEVAAFVHAVDVLITSHHIINIMRRKLMVRVELLGKYKNREPDQSVGTQEIILEAYTM